MHCKLEMPVPLVIYPVSRDSEALKCYWRGNVSATSFGDRAIPTVFYQGAQLQLVDIPGSPTWKQYLRKSLQSTRSGGGEGRLTFDLRLKEGSSNPLISTKTNNFSFCIRFYITEVPNTGTLFVNGTRGINGYTLKVTNDLGYYTLYLEDNNSTFNIELYPNIELNTWYTLGVRWENAGNISCWMNGSIIKQQDTGFTLTTPSGSSRWFSTVSGGMNVVGYISEFVFFDKQLPTTYFTNITPNAPFLDK